MPSTHPIIPAGALAVALAAAGCAEPLETADTSQPATFDAGLCAPGEVFCEDVDAVPRPTPDLSPLVLAPREVTSAGQVIFAGGASATRWNARMRVAFAPTAGATFAEVVVRGRRFRIITAATPPHERFVSHATILDAGPRALGELRLIETLAIDATSAPRVGGGDLAVVAGSAEVVVARAPFDPTFTATPGTCTEKALVRFGPIPWNMPPLDFPEIESCSETNCVTVTEGWIRGHHHVWRVSQMFSGMTAVPEVSRGFYWGQPALDAAGEPIGLRRSSTSPEYYYGAYSDERFFAAREAIWQLLDVFVRARTVGSRVHLRCTDCNDYGYHTRIGWINVCDRAFVDDANLYPTNQDAVTHTVIHEAMHWLSVEFDDGPRSLRDTVQHGHGSLCSPLSKLVVNTPERVRHLATYVAPDGGGCWHQDKAVQAIESHAQLVMKIGEGVRDGELHWWPQPADPTPQPPTCVGGEGCLCEDVPVGGQPESPDGDYSIDHYCDDNDGEMTCVETEVNAGAIVGICTRCEPVRGIGCECELSRPCDVGTCWGDDTYNGGLGRCYEDPPSWACLADCERLFNDEYAYCYHDHLGGARCMDSGCPDYLATACYEQNQVCRDGACVTECASTADCGDLGYPSYFECSTAGRCEYPF